MIRSFSLVLCGAILMVVIAMNLGVAPSFAAPITELFNGTMVSNQDSQNTLTILQKNDVGDSRSASGAFLLDNSGNRNTGVTLYSELGSAVQQPLMRMEIANPAWDEEVLYIRSDSPTSRGLIRLDSPAPEIEFVETDQTGASGKFEVRVQHDELQFNSRRADDTTFENKISMTHEGDLQLAKGTLNVGGSKPAQFAGGINITGGCLAVQGKCLGEAELSAAAHTSDTVEPSAASSLSANISDGAPDALACNSNTERGAMVLDHANNRLYICSGPERGWDYTDLSN
jgi:hypothetical protein